MTQKQLLQDYLRSFRTSLDPEDGWVRSYDLRGKRTDKGFTGHQADRRARELAAEGKIEHRIKGKYAEYRYHVTAVTRTYKLVKEEPHKPPDYSQPTLQEPPVQQSMFQN